MRPKSILILSGGLDSTVSAWIAREQTQPLLALTFDYGQRAVIREIESATATCKILGVRHKVISLPWLSEMTDTALVNRKQPLPMLKESELDSAKTQATAKAVWVPNRNGVFLNIGAATAESLGADLLVTGFNREEGTTFPDNSAPFVRAADEFFWYSTLSKVKVLSYTQAMTKREIAARARALGIDLEKIWFCYEGGEKPCRKCESCARFYRAVADLAPHPPLLNAGEGESEGVRS